MSLTVSAVLGPAVWLLVKVTLLLAIAALAHLLTRHRSSAAARHAGWSAVVMAMLVLPLLSAALPAWDLALPAITQQPVTIAAATVSSPAAERSPSTARSAAAAATPAAAVTTPARSTSWSGAAVVVYFCGVALLLIRLGAHRVAIERLAGRAAVVEDPQWQRLLFECARILGVDRPVRLLRSRESTMPMAFGTRRPAILLPAIADTWIDDRRRAVLLHELAHTSRRDCLTQMLAAIACAVYWIHPGAWWVARRLRIERELACDDLVLTTGARARDYAGHLLELAHTLGGGRAPALVVSMARPRQLEGRLLAVMDTARNRAVPALHRRLAGVALVLVAMVPLAGVQAIVVDARTSDALALPPPMSSAELAVPVALDAGLMAAPRLTAAPAPSPAKAAVPAAAQASQRGTWEIRPNAPADTVHLRMTEGDSSSGSTVPLAQLEGLSAAQLSGAGGPVRFSIRRDGGTFTFEGTARDGVAGGTYAFSPSPTFAAEMEKRGVGRPTADDQYQLARHDIGFAFVDELNAQRYARPSISELVRAGQHGARLAYLRDMGAAGYHLGTLDPLITLRDHGVTPDYVRELAAQGFKGLSADQLRRTRDHGVSAEFVKGLRDQGYSSLTLDQIVTARDHGVSTEFVKGLRDQGYGSLTMDQIVTARDHGLSVEFVTELGALGHRNVPIEQLTRIRDHGVSAGYARELRDLGLTLDLDQLVKSRDHGVSVEYVRELAALGYRNVPLDSLIRLRDHGVTSGYVRELKELGYDRLELDELVGLRDHGVTPERIRSANSRAGTKLPLDMIRALANGGMR